MSKVVDSIGPESSDVRARMKLRPQRNDGRGRGRGRFQRPRESKVRASKAGRSALYEWLQRRESLEASGNDKRPKMRRGLGIWGQKVASEAFYTNGRKTMDAYEASF